MKNTLKKISTLSSILVLIVASQLPSTVFAADPVTDMNSSVNAVSTKPVTREQKLPTGETVRLMTVPGNPTYSFGTITNTDGSVRNIATNVDAQGKVTVNISDGNTTTGVVCESGKTTCNSVDPRAQAIVESIRSEVVYEAQGIGSESTEVNVIVSEPVPGVDCTCISGTNSGKLMLCDGEVQTRKYSCIVKKNLASFQDMLGTLIRYTINIVLILGVLGIVGLGIAWSLTGGDDAKAKSQLKTWTINIIVGLILIFLFSQILRFLAPWVYR